MIPLSQVPLLDAGSGDDVGDVAKSDKVFNWSQVFGSKKSLRVHYEHAEGLQSRIPKNERTHGHLADVV